MKKTCLIVLLCSLVLFVGIIAAGCVQNAGNSSGQPAGTATPSVPGTEPETPAPIQQPGFQTGSYSVQDQNSTLGNGQGVQLDLASAASKLGTTAQQALRCVGSWEYNSGPLRESYPSDTTAGSDCATALSCDRRRECNTGPLREPHRSSTKPEGHGATDSALRWVSRRAHKQLPHPPGSRAKAGSARVPVRQGGQGIMTSPWNSGEFSIQVQEHKP